MKTTFILLSVILGISSAHAQTGYTVVAPEKDYPIQKLIEGYIVFYGFEIVPGSDSWEEFKTMFMPDAKVVIDFPPSTEIQASGLVLEKGSVVGVEKYMDELVEAKENIYLIGPVTSTNKIIRGKVGQSWEAWLENSCLYKEGMRNDTLTMNTKVKLLFEQSGNGEYKISRISAVKEFPEDKDGDYIADQCDRCIAVMQAANNPVVSAHGCELSSLYRKHPSSKFGFTVSAGVLSAINSDIKEKDISAAGMVVKPTYFNRTGMSMDISGSYTFSAFTSLRIGLSFTRNAMDEEHMAKTINDYMSQFGSGSKVQMIRFHKTSKKLYTPYIGLRLGNFYRKNSIVSFEGILGLSIPTNSSNTFNYDMLNSDFQVISSFESQFKAKPFPIYGARLSYETGLTPDGLGRLVIAASYLTGRYSYSNGSLSSGSQNELPNQIFLPTGNRVLFEGSQIHLWGVSAGFFYNLFVPGIKKEQERYFKLVNNTTNQ